MKKIAIVTDSNSGITQAEAKAIGCAVIPMPIIIDGKTYFEELNLTHDEFYELLSNGAAVSTSQPSPATLTETWDELLKTHDEVVHIPMSSQLSMSCETAKMLANDYENRVSVVDNHRISVTLRRSVLDAIELSKSGVSGADIKARLEAESLNSSIYITVDTLKYLIKGGRVTPAAAAFAAILRIKPILQIQGGKLDAFAKVLGMGQARKAMIKAMKSDFETRFKAQNPSDVHLFMAYTFNKAAADDFKREVEAAFPSMSIQMNPLSLSVACHIGHGALAIAASKKITL